MKARSWGAHGKVSTRVDIYRLPYSFMFTHTPSPGPASLRRLRPPDQIYHGQSKTWPCLWADSCQGPPPHLGFTFLLVP